MFYQFSARVELISNGLLAYFVSILIMTQDCTWWWGSILEDLGSVEFPLHCQIFQIHFDLEWQYLLGFNLWIK